MKGKDLFDAVLFSSPDTIQVFFTFMSYLRECILNAHSTQTHKLLSLLKQKKKLLRCYTQNIDGLETHEGLSTGITSKNWKKLDVIQLHGDIHELKCMHCSSIVKWTEESTSVCKLGEAPDCPSCKAVQDDRARRNRRSTGIGRLKPNVVLYGEEHPNGDLIGRCTQSDFKAKPDFLLIAGTSLKVVGIQKLVRQAAKAVRERGGIVIFVNKTEVGSSSWKNVIDFHIEADCDEWVANLKTRIPDFFSQQTKITAFSRKVEKVVNPNDTKETIVAKTDAITSPVTPKRARSRVCVTPSSPAELVHIEDDIVPLTPPSSRRSPRLMIKGNDVENPRQYEIMLPTPEKTPRGVVEKPLLPWSQNSENGVTRKRRRVSKDIDLEFAPIIKRSRAELDLTL